MWSSELIVRFIVSALLGIAASSVSAQDLVILNGRVMDPETGLNAIRNVIVEDGRITGLSEEVSNATVTIDATGTRCCTWIHRPPCPRPGSHSVIVFRLQTA